MYTYYQYARGLLPFVGAITLACIAAVGIARAQDASMQAECTLSADPMTISAGESTSLSWTSMNADTLRLDQGVGDLIPTGSGSVSLSPQESVTYTAEATGMDGTSSCSTFVQVTPADSAGGADAGTEDMDTIPQADSTTTDDSVTPDTSESVPDVDDILAPLQAQISATATTPADAQLQTGTTPSPGAVTPLTTLPIAQVLDALPTAAPTPPLPAPETTPAPMVVDIASDGSALIRGTVQTTGTNSITIATWGGVWTVNTTALSTVIPAGASAGDMSAISVGDFIGVDGTVTAGQAATIDANLIRDWTTDPYTGPVTPDTSPEPDTAAPTSTDEEENADEEAVQEETVPGGEVIDTVDTGGFQF